MKKLAVICICSFAATFWFKGYAQQSAWRLAPGTEAVYDIEVCPSNHDSVYAFIGPALLVSTDRGEHWTSIPSPPGMPRATLGAFKPDVFSSHTLFVSYAWPNLAGRLVTDAVVTTNAGQSWTRISRQEDPVGSTVAERHPREPSTVYLGTGWGKIIRTQNSGQNWDTLGILPDTAGPKTLAVALDDPQVMYASSGGRLSKSTNGGNTWFTVAAFPAEITSIHVCPYDNRVLYVTLFYFFGPPGGVRKSTDGGTSWTELNNGLPDSTRSINGIAQNPSDATDLFLAMEYPIFCYRSTNSGEFWTRFDNGLPTFGHTRCIVADSLNRRIYLGTNSGIYLHDLLTSVSSRDQRKPESVILFQNYPNPFNLSTTITYEMPSSTFVSMKVLDVLGRELATLVEGNTNVGIHEIRFDGSIISSGTYFCRMRVGGHVRTITMHLVK